MRKVVVATLNFYDNVITQTIEWIKDGETWKHALMSHLNKNNPKKEFKSVDELGLPDDYEQASAELFECDMVLSIVDV